MDDRRAADLARELAVARALLESARSDAELLVQQRTSELEAANRLLSELAFSDALTGLANRRALEDRLAELLKDRQPESGPLALVMVDLNDLKTINDVQGHQAGDAALLTLADLLREAAAPLPGSMVARLGGDEFCLLAEQCPAAEIVAVAGGLCVRAYAALPAGVAVGVATTDLLPRQISTAAELLRIADAAQYRAKRSMSRTPVVAGFTPLDVMPGEGAGPRRSFRGRELDVGRTLDTMAGALDRLEERDVASRLYRVATVMAGIVDASTWFVSRVNYGEDRFFTMGSSVSRLSDHYEASLRTFFDDDRGYAIRDFPASWRAAEGRAVEVRADDPVADAQELALLRAGGFREMVMAGGRDRGGSMWLLEVFGDESSLPAASYSLALRSAVAMAISGADPDVPPVRMH